MAFFNVTIEQIGSIDPIDGADRIVKATLKNVAFSFVVGKGLFKVNDMVLYFPIDSIIPQSTQEKLGVTGRLAGKSKDRIKTIKLKGCLSQGIVGSLSMLDEFLVIEYGEDWATKGLEINPSKITEWLGVVKYEPPIIPDKAGNLKALPNNLSIYDIEGCERFYIPLADLMDQKVWVLEKLEGSNGSVSYDPVADTIFVNQRRHTIEEVEGHSHAWWTIARKQRLDQFVRFVASIHMLPVTIYFEVVGPSIQGNIYRLSETKGYIFDLRIGDKFVSKGTMFMLLDQFFGVDTDNYLHAPILARDITLRNWLNGKTIAEASNGESKLFKTLREGIVISPEVEQEDKTLGGRLILKQRDAIYLAGTDN